MQYSPEIECMCPVGRGPKNGPAPIPQEGQWTQARWTEWVRKWHSTTLETRAVRRALGCLATAVRNGTIQIETDCMTTVRLSRA